MHMSGVKDSSGSSVPPQGLCCTQHSSHQGSSDSAKATGQDCNRLSPSSQDGHISGLPIERERKGLVAKHNTGYSTTKKLLLDYLK
jgi:hypothetical protein